MSLPQTEELKREIDVLAQNHDRQVDRKDAILSMLLKDLEVAEEQLCTQQLPCWLGVSDLSPFLSVWSPLPTAWLRVFMCCVFFSFAVVLHSILPHCCHVLWWRCRYRLALRSHLQNVDELIRLQQARIQALSDEFAHDVVVLRKEFMDER